MVANVMINIYPMSIIRSAYQKVKTFIHWGKNVSFVYYFIKILVISSFSSYKFLLFFNCFSVNLHEECTYNRHCLKSNSVCKQGKKEKTCECIEKGFVEINKSCYKSK